MKTAIRSLAVDSIPTPEVIAKAAGRAAIGLILIWLARWPSMEWAALAGKMVLVLAAICLVSHVESVVATRTAAAVKIVFGVLLLPVALIAAAVLVFQMENDREQGIQ